jgi:hypothetical protein
MAQDRISCFAGCIPEERRGNFPCAGSSNAAELVDSTAVKAISLFVSFRLSEKLGLKKRSPSPPFHSGRVAMSR